MTILFAILFVVALVCNFLQTIFWSHLCQGYKKICDGNIETIKQLTAELNRWNKLKLPLKPIREDDEYFGYGLPGRGDE